MNRRKFLRNTVPAAVLPAFIGGFSIKAYAASSPLLQALGATTTDTDKVLVIIQLSGGNDGLNTVVPVRNDIYYRSRPVLGLQREKTLALTDEAGLHPELSFFKSLYDEGHLGILNSVGYPTPDRSHFRSMDVWQSASDSSEVWQTGWLGRYLDEQCKACSLPVQALEIDDTLSLALKGELQKAIALKDPRQLYNNSHRDYLKRLSQAHHQQEHEQPVDYLYHTMAGTLSSADYIFEKSKAKATATLYPKTELGKSLKTIASLILADSNTRVYYVSTGSFDTHVDQEGQQARLFRQINEALNAFTQDMKDNHRFEDVLLFTFSEFGRRVAQNASNGTDHGTANNMFFIGGGLKQQGLLNALPDLQLLQDGDLRYEVDFKSVYATVLNQWLGADDEKILGRKMSRLSFI